MATLLLRPHSPGPRQGILLNPSPHPSPAYHPTALPALDPSNSSLSSASSSSPGDSSDYFSSKSSSPSPEFSAQRDATPSRPNPKPATPSRPNPKPRTASNHSTVRRIRFAPLPEPRRDSDDAELLPSVFFDEDSEVHHSEPQLTLSSALAVASMSLAAPTDSDLANRLQCSPVSPSSSRSATRKLCPTDSLLLNPPISQSFSQSSDAVPPAQHQPAVPSDCVQDWDPVSPSPVTASLSLSLTSRSVPESPRKTKKWSNMLKPLLGRSTKPSLTPEEATTINGDVQRGRSSGPLHAAGDSRNSSVSRDASLTRRESDFGTPLHRWTSEGGTGVALPLSKKKRLAIFGGSSSSGNGVPLGRTQSLTSLSGKDEKKLASTKASSPTTTNGGRKQQRMLNGRVYGAKRNQNAKNPFANIKNEEPEFVEWGYGGMGSVKASAGQSSVWARVQARDDASGLKAKNGTEEDDGSGLTWVKRRREQREKEKKEREEREKAGAQDQDKAKTEVVSETMASNADDDQKVASQDDAQAEASDGLSAATSKEDAPASANTTIPSSAPSTPLASDTSKPQLEHITTAITIPARSPHHHHHHSHSYSHAHATHPSHLHSLSLPHIERHDSEETARGILMVSPCPSNPAPVSDGLGNVLPGSRLRTESSADTEESESVSSSGASAISTTSEDAEDGDGEENPKDGYGNDDEDDEEEDEELERSRRTAVGAGVEKIARHHKEDHSAVGTPAAEASS